MICLVDVFCFQAEDGIRDAHEWLEFRRVLFRSVEVRLGDSRFPISAVSGGQWGANNSTSGVYAACMKLREAIAQKLGVDPGQAEFADGYVRAGNLSFTLADVAEEADLWAEDAIQRSEEHTSELQSLMRISYAVFCLKKKITQ